MSLTEVRDEAVIEYKSCTDENKAKVLAARIAHYDDIIKSTELLCFGSSAHKGYFDE